MPKRARSGGKGRVALLHAIAHIELNAIDLAWDMIARFSAAAPARDFFNDWIGVADEEARHFSLLSDRLRQLDATYGDLPAHDGLWQAAEATSDDVLARLAVVPMVLEARGLDITPGLTADFDRAGDRASAEILERIYRDEINHVCVGNRWFHHICHARKLDPAEEWPRLVRTRFSGYLKPPFNDDARTQAGLSPTLYRALVQN